MDEEAGSSISCELEFFVFSIGEHMRVLDDAEVFAVHDLVTNQTPSP